MTNAHRNVASRLFSTAIVAAVLWIPWPDARGPSLLRSIWITTRDVHKTLATTLGRFEAFQADINTPGSGEYVLPGPVQDMLAIVRGKGRAVRRYQISESLVADNWVRQETVSALWPRRLDPRATARFVLRTDPSPPGCTPIDQHRDVALVYCP